MIKKNKLKLPLNRNREVSSRFGHKVAKTIEVFSIFGIENVIQSKIEIHVFHDIETQTEMK